MSLIGKSKREEPPAAVQLDGAEGEIAGGQYPPEQITVLVKKIYSECSQADCPTNVLVLPAYSAPAATVVDCNIENIVTTSTSIKTNAANPSQSKVTVTLSYNVVVDYADASGNIYTISEESVTKPAKDSGILVGKETAGR